ncbi:MAG: PEGA domain-containing protein [Candidatus Cloacimonetes bacterium]|nr:PEGA domain-containing protein [Candidatus Cloacimonadota bacterium]
MNYVNVPVNQHQPEFSVLVTDVLTGDTISTETNTANIVRVQAMTGPTGMAAWVVFDPQGFPTPLTVPEGREFTIVLTYLPNTNTATNSATKTVTAPGGTAPVFSYDSNGVPVNAGSWFLPQTMFGAAPETYTLGVRSNWAGAAIYLDGVTTGQVTPYTFDPAVAGTYSLVMPNITWTPASFVYAAEADETVTFMGEFTPGVATNPIPADGATLTWADGVTDTVVLSWDPVADADYYNVYWNGATTPVPVTVPTFTTPVIGDGAYSWQIVPYVTDPAAPAKGARKASPIAAKVSGSSSIRGGAVGAPVWGFTIEYEPPIYTLTITSDPVGAAIYVGAVDTGEVTPFDFTVAGTYSVAMAGYTFAPTEYVWDGLADAAVNFVGTEVGPFDLTITSTPAGATIFIDGVKQLVGSDDLVTPHTFVNAVAGVYEVRLVRWAWTPETYTYTAAATETVNFVGTAIPVDIEPNETLPYAGVIDSHGDYYPIDIPLLTTVNLTGDEFLFHGANYIHATPTNPFAPVPAAVLNTLVGDEFFTVDREDRYEMVGEASDATVYITTNAPIFMYHTGDFDWIIYQGPISNDPYTFPLEFTNGYTIFEWNTGWIDARTVPVELSSFTAQLTAQRFVELTWISATETNMLGYRVYRNETQEASTATLISELYDATNTSSTAVYHHTDRNVSAGNTYYYWLEAVDYNHSTMFGPQYVEVTAEPVAPEIIVQTAMKNAYPNPFKANTNTNIEVAVKAGETGTVTIYNVLGQVVQSYKVGAGINNLKWNGQDTRGSACGSGIYFYKLSTPSMNQTKKMVIIK